MALFSFFTSSLSARSITFSSSAFFKRPELTWITFPIVVVGLSVLVYCVAYAMKGDNLRINEIDLVEYDFGRPATAFTVRRELHDFMRAVQTTLGVEPSAQRWTIAPGRTTRYPIRSKSTVFWPVPNFADAGGMPACSVNPTPMQRTLPG